MAVTGFFYGAAFLSAFNKEIDFAADDIRVALLADTYTPSQDTHAYFSDVVANEVSGVGYTAGGPVLGTPAITYDGALNTVKLDGDNVSLTDSTLSARYAVVYNRTPATDSTRPLIALVDFGVVVSSEAGLFSIIWDNTGIATITLD